MLQPEGSLHIRASVDDTSGVEQMLKAGAQIDQRDDQGCTPLHWAADRGSQQVQMDACELVSMYADGSDWELSPQVIKTLLAHGADVNAADIDGQTPLQYALLCDNQQVSLRHHPDRDSECCLREQLHVHVCVNTRYM